MDVEGLVFIILCPMNITQATLLQMTTVPTPDLQESVPVTDNQVSLYVLSHQ